MFILKKETLNLPLTNVYSLQRIKSETGIKPMKLKKIQIVTETAVLVDVLKDILSSNQLKSCYTHSNK